MAAYAIEQDIIERYGAKAVTIASDRNHDQISDEVGGVSTIDKALDDGAGEIDAIISARFELPLVTVPDVLVECNVDIAFYRLNFGHDTLTDEIKSRYKQCIALLQRIADGKAGLGLVDPPLTVGGGASIVGPGRLFTRTTQRNLP